MFTATISRSDSGGETIYHARVRFAGRQVFAWSGPTENYVQCEVLDWATRTGKTKQLNWEYPMNQIRTLQRFAAQGLAAQASVDQLTQPNRNAALLDPRESAALGALEETIARGLDTFIEVGDALCQIRDSRLYRERHQSFEHYCRERWGMTGRHAHRLVDSAQIAHNLTATPAELKQVTNWSAPKNESQVRPLKGLTPDEQVKVWAEAVSSEPIRQITARHVKEALERLHPKPKCETPPEPRVVEVKMQRVCSGGDIDRTNCHDLLARTRGFDDPLPELKGVFEFERDLWVVSLGHHGGCPPDAVVITQEAHRLVPDNSLYKGPGPHECFAEGRLVLWRGSRMRLGPTVIFKAEGREPKPQPKTHDESESTIEFSLGVDPTVKPTSDRQRLLLSVDLLIKDCTTVHACAQDKDLVGKFSTVELLHLSVALTHLKNFRNSVHQMEKKQEKKQPVMRDAKKPASLKAKLAARWKAAKAVAKSKPAPPAANSADLHVLCRKEKDSGRPTYQTKAKGWTTNPAKAETFPNATAAKFSAHHSYDKPLKLKTALRSFEASSR